MMSIDGFKSAQHDIELSVTAPQFQSISILILDLVGLCFYWLFLRCDCSHNSFIFIVFSFFVYCEDLVTLIGRGVNCDGVFRILIASNPILV